MLLLIVFYYYKLSMGADLFSEAKIQMDNLSLRPDVFDVYLQPLKLVSGLDYVCCCFSYCCCYSFYY